MIFLTTTAIDIDEELLNRCLVLTVDEDPRANASHPCRQRRSIKRSKVWCPLNDSFQAHALHQNAQRLIRPIGGRQSVRKSTRVPGRSDPSPSRSHEIFNTDQRSIAFLHQYQRAVRSRSRLTQPTCNTSKSRHAISNRQSLASFSARSSSIDELAPQTRRLLIAHVRIGSQAVRRARD